MYPREKWFFAVDAPSAPCADGPHVYNEERISCSSFGSHNTTGSPSRTIGQNQEPRMRPLKLPPLIPFLIAFMVVVCGAGIMSCANQKPENLANTNQNLLGCDPGSPCNVAGGTCHYDPADPSSGKLDCDTSDPNNQQWVTQCAAGYFCDATHFPNGCVTNGGQQLRCGSPNVLQVSVCGDGIVDPNEACDDGNNVDCDGCRGDCSAVETGCGDGFVCGTEACDDGNGVNGDTCDVNCTLPACGNGIVDPGEACDDGNSVNGDGCDNNCTVSACGNGIVAGSEMCDDGNLVDGDGCDSNCTPTGCGNGVVTAGEQCDDGLANSNAPDAACRLDCTLKRCGDGVVDTGEQCDDGVNNGLSGCDPECVLPSCGDGIVNGTEQCDDGVANANTPDACRTNCMNPTCGDGIVDTGEECDDGNLVDGDGCSSACVVEPMCSSTTTVPCQPNSYGCFPAAVGGVVVTSCMYDPDGAGPLPSTELDCLCPNPSDNDLGTMLPPGTPCTAQNLCWDPGATTSASSTTASSTAASTSASTGAGGGAGGASSSSSTAAGTGGATSSSSSTAASSTAASTSASTGAGGGIPSGVDPVICFTPSVNLMPTDTPWVEGWWKNNAGVNQAWGSLCGAPMALSGSDWCCTLTGLGGAQYIEAIVDFHVNAQLCSTFNQEPGNPCSDASGDQLGTVRMSTCGNTVTFVPPADPSNPQPSDNEIYNNHCPGLPEPPSCSQRYYFNLRQFSLPANCP